MSDGTFEPEVTGVTGGWEVFLSCAYARELSDFAVTTRHPSLVPSASLGMTKPGGFDGLA